MKRTKDVILLGLLLGMEIVLTRFLSIQTPFLRLSLGFIPMAIAAAMYGPIIGGLLYGLADVTGFFIFSSGYTFFPGFTLTAIITGVLFGLFLKSDKNGLNRSLLASLSVTIVCTLILNTYWLSVLYGTNFNVLFITRLPQAAFYLVVQFIVFSFIVSPLRKPMKLFINN